MINYYKIIQPVLYYTLSLTEATRYYQKTHFTLSVPQCSLKAQWILQIEVFFHGAHLNSLQISVIASAVSREQMRTLTASLEAQLNPPKEMHVFMHRR